MMLVAANCGCGCGSFAVSVPDAAPAALMGDVPTLMGGEPPVEVLPVIGDDGRLASVEVTYFVTDADDIPAASALTPRWPR